MEPTFSSRLVAVAIITAPDQAAIASAAAILARVGRAVHLVMFGGSQLIRPDISANN